MKNRNKEEQRKKLTVDIPVAEAKENLDQNLSDPELWYVYGMSLFRAKRYSDAEDVFSQGLTYNPFHPYLYFGRGRAKSKENRFWPSVADFEMALRLDSQNWNFWYYIATAYNGEGYYPEAVDAFENAIKYSYPDERSPMVYWLYLIHLLDLDDKDSAQKVLSLIEDDVVPPPNDYGYHRSILLFKNLLSSDTFVNRDDMKEKCLKKPGRINTELNVMYYALYAYGVRENEPALSEYAIRELLKVKNPSTFAYIKGAQVAERMRLL